MDPISELIFSGDEANIELARQLAKGQGLPEPPLYTALLAAMWTFDGDDWIPTEDLASFLTHIRKEGLWLRADVLSFDREKGDFEELSWKVLAPITKSLSILANQEEESSNSDRYAFTHLAAIAEHLRDFQLEHLFIDFSAVGLRHLPEHWDLSRLRYFRLPIEDFRFPLARYAPNIVSLKISGIHEAYRAQTLREFLSGFAHLSELTLEFLGEAHYPSWWAGSTQYGAFLVDANAFCAVLLDFPKIKTLHIKTISTQTYKLPDNPEPQRYRCSIPVLKELQAQGRDVHWEQ